MKINSQAKLNIRTLDSQQPDIDFIRKQNQIKVIPRPFTLKLSNNFVQSFQFNYSRKSKIVQEMRMKKIERKEVQEKEKLEFKIQKKAEQLEQSQRQLPLTARVATDKSEIAEELNQSSWVYENRLPVNTKARPN